MGYAGFCVANDFSSLNIRRAEEQRDESPRAESANVIRNNKSQQGDMNT
jgi:hypothetical protein